MKVLLQRVSRALVSVGDETISEIGPGLCLLVGLGAEDDQSKLAPMANKIANLRIFPDEKGRFHFSVLDTKGSALVVPQFTLYADTSHGRRPEFFSALAPDKAAPLVEQFAKALRTAGVAQVGAGRFGAHMQVSLTNDGPVTIMLES